MEQGSEVEPGREAGREAGGSRRSALGARSRQRVSDILRSARQVFIEKGFEAATTIEIAQRLGVSEATVFSYFSGKRDLCVQVIVDWYDEIIAGIEAGLPQAGGVVERFAFIVRAHLRLFLAHGTGMSALVLSEGRGKNHALADTLLAQQRRYTAPMMAVLAQGQAEGLVRRDMPLRLLRSMVFGPMEHVLWDTALAEQAGAVADIDATAAQLVDMLWRAIAAPDEGELALRRFRDEVQAAVRRLNGVPPA